MNSIVNEYLRCLQTWTRVVPLKYKYYSTAMDHFYRVARLIIIVKPCKNNGRNGDREPHGKLSVGDKPRRTASANVENTTRCCFKIDRLLSRQYTRSRVCTIELIWLFNARNFYSFDTTTYKSNKGEVKRAAGVNMRKLWSRKLLFGHFARL